MENRPIYHCRCRACRSHQASPTKQLHAHKENNRGIGRKDKTYPIAQLLIRFKMHRARYVGRDIVFFRARIEQRRPLLEIWNCFPKREGACPDLPERLGRRG